jgi:hypothetical protein
MGRDRAGELTDRLLVEVLPWLLPVRLDLLERDLKRAGSEGG